MNSDSEKMSIKDINIELKTKHGTLLNSVKNFRLRQSVQVICMFQDFHYFNGETGKIIKIRHDSLYPITVKFDIPKIIHCPDDSHWTMETFNFKPDDLIRLSAVKEKKKKQGIEKEIQGKWKEIKNEKLPPLKT